jgi:hypothetical protein
VADRTLDAFLVAGPRPGVATVEPYSGAAFRLDRDIDDGHDDLLDAAGMRLRRGGAVALSRRSHHWAMNQTTISVVINPIVVRIAVDCGVVVSTETARAREVLVRRMG